MPVLTLSSTFGTPSGQRHANCYQYQRAGCNNRSYRVLKLNIDKYRSMVLDDEGKSQYLGMDFPPALDLAGMARSIGVFARTIENPDDVAPAMRSALESGKPAMLDVVIDGSL